MTHTVIPTHIDLIRPGDTVRIDFRGEDGLAEWVADFVSHDDAVKFKEMNES